MSPDQLHRKPVEEIQSHEIDSFLKRRAGDRPGGRDIVALQEFFGEFLACLELGRLKVRSPAWDSGLFAEIGKAFALHEVAFLAGDAEADLVGGHPVDEGLEAIGRDRLCELEDRVAAGKAKHLRLSR